MVKTQDFQKQKKIFGLNFARARDFEQMQEIPPPHRFFRQLILRDTPCPSFREM